MNGHPHYRPVPEAGAEGTPPWVCGERFRRSLLKERGRSRPTDVLCWFVLRLAGRVEVGVGVKARAEPDRVSGRRALTATPFGACCSGLGDRKGLCCFRVCSGGGSLSHQGRFPGRRGRRKGCSVIPSPRAGGMMGCAGTGRSGSIRGRDLAGVGGHDLHDPRRP